MDTYFKVGDKVTVRDDLDINRVYYSKNNKHDAVTPAMASAGGKEAEIISLDNDKYHVKFLDSSFRISSTLFWTDEMFKEFPDEESEKIDKAVRDCDYRWDTPKAKYPKAFGIGALWAIFSSNNNLEVIHEAFKRDLEEARSLYMCFSPFYNIYNNKEHFYLGFPACIEWFEDALKKLNESFSSIKWNLIKNEIMTEVINKVEYKYSVPLMEVTVSPELNKNGRFMLMKMAAIILRCLCYGFGYIKYGDKPENMDVLLEWILKVQAHDRYLGISEKKLSVEQFLKLNDIEAVNKYAETEALTSSYSFSQTKLMSGINEDI